MERRRPVSPCAGVSALRQQRWIPSVVAAWLLVLVVSSLLAGLAEAQQRRRTSTSTDVPTSINSRAFCLQSCLGRCNRVRGEWKCISTGNSNEKCSPGYVQAVASSPLCDHCASGYGSALEARIEGTVANGWSSCTAQPCTKCYKCPLLTNSLGGAIAPNTESGAAICAAGTGTSVPGDGYIDGNGNQASCPAPFTGGYARDPGDPLAKVCFPPTNFAFSRFLVSTPKNKIPIASQSIYSSSNDFDCLNSVGVTTALVGAACVTCPDGYTGSGCNEVQGGYYGDATGGTYGLHACPGDTSSVSPVSQPSLAAEVCTTCAIGFVQTAASPLVCAACPEGTVAMPGGPVDPSASCPYCALGRGGTGCAPCGSNFAAVGLRYILPTSSCSAADVGCAAGWTGTKCDGQCPQDLPTDTYAGDVPLSGTGAVEAPDGISCMYGCLKGYGLNEAGTACEACGGNQYSPGGAYTASGITSYARCITCPASTVAVDGNSRCVMNKAAPTTAKGIFDEFD